VKQLSFCAVIVLAIVGGALSTAPSAQAPATVDFGRDVQPILRENCVDCHGPGQQMRGLRLDRRRDALPNRVGANGVTILPGNGAASRLYLRVSGTTAGLQMPPSGPLAADQIDIIKRWIDQGADWPDHLAGEATPPPQDPRAAQLMTALRKGDRPLLRRLLDTSADHVNRYGMDGGTPLVDAALYGDAEDVRRLLEAGADPNLRSAGNTTALMFAVDDADKTRLLLEHGADPNARSDEGQTALMIAVARPGASDVVARLIQAGAQVKVAVTGGAGILARAALSADPALVRLLLSHGVERKPLPLAAALRRGCAECGDSLLALAERAELDNALRLLLEFGDAEPIRRLLDRDARPPVNALALLALWERAIPVDMVGMLIDRGADVNATAPFVGSLLTVARRRGDTVLAEALLARGARADTAVDSPAPAPSAAASVRAALARSLPLLQRADRTFIHKAGCVSCHNNSLTAMSVSTARKYRVPVDEAINREQVAAVAKYLETNHPRALQGIGTPGGLDTAGYVLLGMAAAGYPPNATTDGWARYLKNLQRPDGHWPIGAPSRAPHESSSFQTTATALRVLHIYAPASRRAEYEGAVKRGAEWLAQTAPRTTEDRTFQLFGLHWAGAGSAVIDRAARDLLAQQRSDGGWSQLPWLASDAYATGQVLTALRESGTLKPAAAAYLKGVRFLMDTQLADGSWYVRSRASAIQPFFDSDFPHGPHQFISAAATNWAVMALAPAVSR
jgi:ankyrin repeat protein/mono/diheme cytochrome c family protein